MVRLEEEEMVRISTTEVHQVSKSKADTAMSTTTRQLIIDRISTSLHHTTRIERNNLHIVIPLARLTATASLLSRRKPTKISKIFPLLTTGMT